MLLVLQKPDATHVAGFHTWRKLGRHVRKGEKGITIFAPMVRRKREPQSETSESSEKTVVGYQTCAVFDVSQTEGKPLPSIGRVQGDACHYGEKLATFARSLSIRLEYSEAIRPARGRSEGGKITLLPELDSAEHVAVLAHELAHEFLHHHRAARPPRRPSAKPKSRPWPM
jgi:antirestriction protein ArdC